jgi:S-adenosylmethionine decarboxylase
MQDLSVGTHFIADMCGIDSLYLQDRDLIENIMIEACRKAGATILKTVFHHFGEGQGVTGVIVLAESHASIHTWPEHGFAAIDVFTCGVGCDSSVAISHLKERFNPKECFIFPIKRRGIVG